MSGVSGKKRKRESEGEMKAAKRLKGVAVQRHHTLAPDILVKETPVKKQVENYRRFKLQRLRSKSSVLASPGVEVIQESPRRSFYSAPKPPQPKKTPLFKTPPLKESAMKHLSPNLSLNKEPSPAALHSLLHGHFVPPDAVELGTNWNQEVHKGRFTSPLVHSNKVEDSPDLFDAKEHTKLDSHSTINTVNHRGIPSLISPDMFASSKDVNTPLPSSESPLEHSTKTSSSRTPNQKQLNYKSARMLTYENENPLRTPSKFKTPSKVSNTTHSSVDQTVDNRFSSGLLSSNSGTTRNNSSTDVVLVSPPPVLESTTSNSVCFLSNLDPSIENESASMMAFALSTPPKDNPKDFHQAFSSQ